MVPDGKLGLTMNLQGSLVLPAAPVDEQELATWL